ncbi:MAG: helix-turn-helix domain-containing protein [Enterovibrio sp.]
MGKVTVDLGLAGRVNARIKELNFPRSVVARRSGVTVSQIGHICAGRVVMISAVLAVRLADALQCDLRWLITGEGEK